MPYSNFLPDNSQNYAASNLPVNPGLNIPQTVPPNFPTVNMPNAAPYNNVNSGSNGIEDEGQNFEYVPEVEDSPNPVEAPRVEDPHSDLTKYTTLLKLQLNPASSVILDAINVSFTSGGTVVFENSHNSPNHKSNSTPPLYYDINSSSSTEEPVPLPPPDNLLDSWDKNSNYEQKAATNLSIFYAELDSEESSDSNEEKRKLKIGRKKKRPPSVLYLYDASGNVYLREDKIWLDPRGYLSQENLGEKNEIERGQYDELQELLE
ncbi:11476_t:CDS:2 [Gigaspora rosea]|nr:11476_t:CDS:2 [Gigaspora rosea]